MRAATRCLRGILQAAIGESAPCNPCSIYQAAKQSHHAVPYARGHAPRCITAVPEGWSIQNRNQHSLKNLASDLSLQRPFEALRSQSGPAWSSSAAYSTTATSLGKAVNAKTQAMSAQHKSLNMSNLRPAVRKYRKRRARGGGDKQAGRGHKGQKSRSGTGKPALFFEGGQTPFWKMLPKRGFKNRFSCKYDNVLLAEIDAAVRMGRLDPTRVITVKHLYDAGLLEKKAYNRDGVQILAKQPSRWKRRRLEARHFTLPEKFSIPVDLEVQRVSEPAREAIEAAGGRVKRTYYNKLGVKAVLLPEWFAKKGRLVPRAVQLVPFKFRWRFDGVGTIPARDAPALEDVPPPQKEAPPPEKEPIRATG